MTHPAQAGFTMIEVMIALVLTAIAVMGVVGLITVETRDATAARHTTEASVLAESQMEALRTQTLAASGTGADTTAVDAQGVTGQTTSIYTRSWTWTVGTAYITYNVSVSWMDDGGGAVTTCPATPSTTVRCVTMRSLRGL
ncbi:MAG: type IV pilus modification PilV family protein [Acidobacteriota bacterium]